MKLMVAIPTLDMIHYEFAKCLMWLVRRLEHDGVDFDVCFKGGTLVYNAREALAADAINNGYTHILWIDADMVFEPDVFAKLSAHGKPYVCGVYQGRHAPYKPCIFSDLETGERVTQYPQELFEIGGSGFGLVLTETAMLYDICQRYGNMFLPTAMHSEDLSLCHKAKECGYKLYCDPSVEAGHIGFVTIWTRRQK